MLARRFVWLWSAQLLLVAGGVPAQNGEAVSAAGISVALQPPAGAARVTATLPGAFRLDLRVDPRGEQQPLAIRVELPATGRQAWPLEDVQVVGAEGRPLPVQRNGIEWHVLLFTVPPTPGTYRVEALPFASLPTRPESARTATEAATGLQARLCRWWGGRQTALSLRFDDSHPTHLQTVIPLLREHGLKGTFMVNPGTNDYRQRQEEWEACARAGDQELANHTLHHRGAAGEAEARREIGEAADYLAALRPGQSRLCALNLGGGTTWVTNRPLRVLLDEFHLFTTGGSLGMDDGYGGRVEALRAHLERHLASGGWCRVHFHSVGEGRASSLANFQAALALIEARRPQLWVAGMADIHKYQAERQAAALTLQGLAAGEVQLALRCLTDPGLYDQPLTVELALPPAWHGAAVAVRDGGGRELAVRAGTGEGATGVQFDVPPLDATYTVTPVRAAPH